MRSGHAIMKIFVPNIPPQTQSSGREEAGGFLLRQYATICNLSPPSCRCMYLYVNLGVSHVSLGLKHH